MIKVKALIHPEYETLEIEVSGHANYAPKGKDIVCAGVSAVVTGALNNLNQDSFDITHEDGHVVIKKIVDKDISKHDKVVIETMMTQLKTIEYSYSKHIQIQNYL